MSYKTITQCANDENFTNRVTAACAQEGATTSPESAMYEIRWGISAASDIEAAYASALAGGNEDPGGDESVITDGMILAYVQANPPTTDAPPAP